MADLINRQVANEYFDLYRHSVLSTDEITSMIPTAEPVRHGRWVHKPDIYLDEQTWECSECGEPWTFIVGSPLDNNANYCPNCGARME